MSRQRVLITARNVRREIGLSRIKVQEPKILCLKIAEPLGRLNAGRAEDHEYQY